MFAPIRLSVCSLVFVAMCGVATAAACPAPPSPVAVLDLKRYYTDASGSVVNEDIRRDNKRQTEPLKQFLRRLSYMVDNGWHIGDVTVRTLDAACALSWLTAWAKAGSLAGTMPSKQGEHHRKWVLTGLALAYLKLEPAATPDERRDIGAWLKAMADDAYRFFESGKVKRNNHWYWLGLGTGAVAEATGSERLWHRARSIFEDAAKGIAVDGSLPMEMKRGKRSLHYHAFAVTPLVAMAEIAAARGEDWYKLEDGALHRLVGLTRHGLNDPQVFDKLTGIRQAANTRPGSGWEALYRQRFPDGSGETALTVPLSHRWLGGDVRALRAALAARAKAMHR